jgi:hypothetical protein
MAKKVMVPVAPPSSMSPSPILTCASNIGHELVHHASNTLAFRTAFGVGLKLMGQGRPERDTPEPMDTTVEKTSSSTATFVAAAARARPGPILLTLRLSGP